MTLRVMAESSNAAHTPMEATISITYDWEIITDCLIQEAGTMYAIIEASILKETSLLASVYGNYFEIVEESRNTGHGTESTSKNDAQTITSNVMIYPGQPIIIFAAGVNTMTGVCSYSHLDNYASAYAKFTVKNVTISFNRPHISFWDYDNQNNIADGAVADGESRILVKLSDMGENSCPLDSESLISEGDGVWDGGWSKNSGDCLRIYKPLLRL